MCGLMRTMMITVTGWNRAGCGPWRFQKPAFGSPVFEETTVFGLMVIGVMPIVRGIDGLRVTQSTDCGFEATGGQPVFGQAISGCPVIGRPTVCG